MFSDLDKNYEMLLGSYKKIKKYYNYNKNFIFMKKKVAEFEYDEKIFDESLHRLAKVLQEPHNYGKTINEWINAIDVYILPKGFKHSESNPMIVKGIDPEPAVVNKVNFFINIPLELYLLDTLWTVLVGKVLFEKKTISDDVYGNVLDNYVIFNKQDNFLESINFKKSNLFKNYYQQYCAWKNNSIAAVDKAYSKGKSTVLASLDIKGYFYSVQWNFELLEEIIQNDEIEESIWETLSPLTEIIKKIYSDYQIKLFEYRDLQQNKGDTVLPIGLFSSMLIGNVYLHKFDKYIKGLKNVLYYGRYVDDILILMDTTELGKISDDDLFETILLGTDPILSPLLNSDYCMKDFPNLIIQSEKVKLFYFERSNGYSLIAKLKETKIIPSQSNVVPDDKLNLIDFESAAFAISDFSTNTKIRDIGHMEIDRYKLGRHMSQLVSLNKYKSRELSTEEKQERQGEQDKILKFFNGVNACEYSSNWVNALYFFMETGENNCKNWKRFEYNVRRSIDSLKVNRIENVKKNKRIKTIIKNNLHLQLNICIATALALNLSFSKKEMADIIDMAGKIRKANLFNHYLVKFPLVNYSDHISDDVNLMDMPLELFHSEAGYISGSRKVNLSPRFVYLDEIFHFVFLYQSLGGGDYYNKKPNEKMQNLMDFFYRINCIRDVGKTLPFIVENNEESGYNLQRVIIKRKKFDKKKISIAIANTELNINRCCYGLNNSGEIQISYSQLLDIMSDVYKDRKRHVDFLLLPEFYLPIHWISDIISFVRKSGITVITGLQYVVDKEFAHNNIAVFLPIQEGGYSSACMIVREKNDYAPFEKELLALKGYKCEDQAVPTYNVFSTGGLNYGTFLCYEFTDIRARSLYKNQIDILFTPEHNKDTSYFSSIIESLVRDLHIFIAQANTSSYGDSRITGPYSRDDRNVVQIKGGVNDSVIIGTVDLEYVQKAEREEMKKMKSLVADCLNLSLKEKFKRLKKYMNEPSPKVSGLSARYNRDI